MTEQRFQFVVRQYARLAQRKRKSYAQMVLACYVLRLRQIDAEHDDEDARRRAGIKARAFVRNEYAPNDRALPAEADWQLPVI